MNQQDLFKTPVADIQPESVRDELAEIYLRYMRKEISHEDYCWANAAWAANNLSEYRHLPYPPFPDSLIDYVSTRSRELGMRNPEMHKSLACWSRDVRKAQIQNEKRHSNLVWSEQQLRGKTNDLADRVQFFRAQFESTSRSEFPENRYGQSIAALEQDSISAQRETARAGAR